MLRVPEWGNLAGLPSGHQLRCSTYACLRSLHEQIAPSVGRPTDSAGRQLIMADKNNSGQFGNRDDTEEQAHKGGEASTGSFGEKNSADPSAAGRDSSGSFGESNAADPSEEGRKGGHASSGSFGDENSADPSEAGRKGGRSS